MEGAAGQLFLEDECWITNFERTRLTERPEYTPDMHQRPQPRPTQYWWNVGFGWKKPLHINLEKQRTRPTQVGDLGWWKTPWRFQHQEKQRMRRTKRARRPAAGAQEKLAERKRRLNAMD